jgi:hypothetical protein
MVRGRLVRPDPIKWHVSWWRLALVMVMLTYLYATNPANHDAVTKGKTLLSKHFGANSVAHITNWWSATFVVPSSSWNLLSGYSVHPNSPFTSYRAFTNFGLFSVHEQANVQAIVSAAGLEWRCRYDFDLLRSLSESTSSSSSSSSTVALALFPCRLLQGMMHHGPLVYDEADIVYTTHRAMAWLVLGAALVACCGTAPMVVQTNSVVWDALLGLWFDTHSETWPLVSASVRLLQLNVVLYPALLAMHTTVAQQDPKSIFAMWDTDAFNFGLALMALWGLAVVIAVASHVWSRFQSLSQWDALMAVAMGYFARFQASGITVSTTTSEAAFFSNGNNVDADVWNAMAWGWLLLWALRGKWWTAMFWCLAHFAGQSLSAYQLDHVATTSMTRTFYRWYDSATRTAEQLFVNLFGPSRYRKKYT